MTCRLNTYSFSEKQWYLLELRKISVVFGIDQSQEEEKSQHSIKIYLKHVKDKFSPEKVKLTTEIEGNLNCFYSQRDLTGY